MATTAVRPPTQPSALPTPPPTMRLRTYLLLAFLFVSIVPIVLLAIAIATHNANHDEQAARDRVRETAIAIQLDVDAHLDDLRRPKKRFTLTADEIALLKAEVPDRKVLITIPESAKEYPN